MVQDSRLLEIEMLLEREKKYIRQAQEIIEHMLPVLDDLTRGQILSPVILKTKLNKIDAKYRAIIYALFIIATNFGPQGAFIILTPPKVRSIIQEIIKEDEPQDDHRNIVPLLTRDRKGVEGFSKLHDVVQELLCDLVADVMMRKVIDKPRNYLVSDNLEHSRTAQPLSE